MDAITAEGPIIVTNITKKMIKLCKVSALSFLYQHHALVSVVLHHSVLDRNALLPINHDKSLRKKAHNWHMVLQNLEFPGIPGEEHAFRSSFENNMFWIQYRDFYSVTPYSSVAWSLRKVAMTSSRPADISGVISPPAFNWSTRTASC